MREALPDDIGVSVSYPLPGHPLPRHGAASSSATKTHWVDSDDLAMMFQGTYQIPLLPPAPPGCCTGTSTCGTGWPSWAAARATGPAGQLDELGEQWLELGRLEATPSASPAPTSVMAVGLTPAPDLAREWN